MLHLTGASFYPPSVTSRQALAAEVTQEFDQIASRSADTTLERSVSISVRNRAAQADENYKRGADGAAYHRYVDDRTGTGDWTPLGNLMIADDIAAAYNPAAGGVEVYAVGTDGLLHHCTLLDVRHGHSDWEVVGATPMAGSPSAVFNRATELVEIWCRGGDGAVHRTVKENRAHRPWSVLDHRAGGDPAALYDDATGVVRGYAVAADGAPYEIGVGALGNVVLQGRPEPIFNPARGVVELYARGRDGRVYQSLSRGAWSIVDAQVVSSDPVAVFDGVSRRVAVYVDGGRLGEI